MKHNYCTLFDSGYLIKGVAMILSLLKHNPESDIHVLCMDQEAYEILKSLAIKNVYLIRIEEIEDEDLLKVKNKRGRAEYCWTLSPCLPHYVLNKNSEIEFITYLDADLFIYSSVEPIYLELQNGSIAITEHKFSDPFKDREVNGRFCVQWVSFRRNAEGMACLQRWRDQCIEWCFYRLEDGKMGDQKYLDEWPERYPSCHIVQHPGVGIAPWNFSQYQFAQFDNGLIRVNGAPLIFYHFHQLQILENEKFDRLSNVYRVDGIEPNLVYEVYENALIEALKKIRMVSPNFCAGIQRSKKIALRRWIQRYIPPSIKNMARKYIRL
jgi:hypothetical protein